MTRLEVPNGIKTFAEFWPFYLREHLNPTCRRLHFIGTTLVFATLIAACATQQWWALLMMPVFGYSFAWVGHLKYEGNKPATWKYPFFSLAADFVMYFKILFGTLEAELTKIRAGS